MPENKGKLRTKARNFQSSGEIESMQEFEFYEYFMFLSVHISEKIFGHLKAKVQYMMC